MSPVDLNRNLRALELTDPSEAARLEELSVAAVLFSFFSGDSDVVVLATRATALGQTSEPAVPNSEAVAAAQAYIEGHPMLGFEGRAQDVRPVLFPLKFRLPGD